MHLVEQNKQGPELVDSTFQTSNRDSRVHAKYVEQFVEVLYRISRTCQGISDTSTSCDKEKLLYEGEALTNISINNLRVSLHELLRNSDLVLTNAEQVLSFIERLAEKVNHGLVERDRPIYRTWETGIETHVPLKDLYQAMQEFSAEFAERFNHSSDKLQAIALAAWIERKFNTEIHPLSDGCGRVSKLLAAFVLARAEVRYPNFTSRQEYFENILKPLPHWQAFYAGKVYTHP